MDEDADEEKIMQKRVSERFRELGLFYIEKGMKINFHDNFVDLNNDYR